MEQDTIKRRYTITSTIRKLKSHLMEFHSDRGWSWQIQWIDHVYHAYWTISFVSTILTYNFVVANFPAWDRWQEIQRTLIDLPIKIWPFPENRHKVHRQRSTIIIFSSVTVFALYFQSLDLCVVDGKVQYSVDFNFRIPNYQTQSPYFGFKFS